MRRLLIATSLILALAACGRGGARPDQASSGGGNCALLTDADAILGAGAVATGARGLEGMDGSCHWDSADGTRSADLVTYTTASLGSTTLDAKMAETIEKWDALTETPLAPAEGLGEGAQIATDLPGYQVQIVFRKGDTLVLVLGSSGDSAVTSEQIARRVAASVAGALPAQ